MVGRERIQFGVKIYVLGMDPNPRMRCVHDIHNRVDLRHRNSQRGTPINDRVFTKEYDLTGCRGFGHGI
jgi:hypothetical protein